LRILLEGTLKARYGRSTVDVNVGENSTLVEAISVFSKELVSPDGDLRFDLLYLVNGSDADALDGGLTQVNDDDIITIIPIFHGGRRHRGNEVPEKPRISRSPSLTDP